MMMRACALAAARKALSLCSGPLSLHSPRSAPSDLMCSQQANAPSEPGQSEWGGEAVYGAFCTPKKKNGPPPHSSHYPPPPPNCTQQKDNSGSSAFYTSGTTQRSVVSNLPEGGRLNPKRLTGLRKCACSWRAGLSNLRPFPLVNTLPNRQMKGLIESPNVLLNGPTAGGLASPLKRPARQG